MQRGGRSVVILSVIALPAAAAIAAGLSAWGAQPAVAGPVAVHRLNPTDPPTDTTITVPTTIVSTVTITKTVTAPPKTTFTRASATTTATAHSTEISNVTATATATSTRTRVATSTTATTATAISLETSHTVATEHVTTTAKHVPFSHDAQIGLIAGGVAAVGVGSALVWWIRRRARGPDHVL